MNGRNESSLLGFKRAISVLFLIRRNVEKNG